MLPQITAKPCGEYHDFLMELDDTSAINGVGLKSRIHPIYKVASKRRQGIWSGYAVNTMSDDEA